MKKIIKKIICNSEKALLYNKKCIFDSNSYFDKRCKFEGRNRIGENSILKNVEIGYGTYIANNCTISDSKFGRYCSIGPNFNTLIGKHPTERFVSTHPSFYSINSPINESYIKSQKFKEKIFLGEKYCVQVGNDVWIGGNVSILDGVVINDGAIVAAGSVIVKDVPPYAIVGGIPAKVIKYRFNMEDINYLLNLKWWNKEEEWIKSKSEYFENIKMLKLNIEQNE